MLDVVNQFTFENFTKEVYKALNNSFPIHALQKKSTTLVNTFETSDHHHTTKVDYMISQRWPITWLGL